MKISKNKTKEIEDFYKLMKKIHNNPEAGLRDFYEEYSKFLYGLAKLFHKSSLTSDEIVQEVVIKIWKAADNPKLIENPKGWIYTITVNSAKSMLRRRYDKPLDESMVAQKDEIEDFIETDAFHSMIRNLSLKEQEIITQKILACATFEEIAEVMSIPSASVASTYYRSLEKIKKDLEKNP